MPDKVQLKREELVGGSVVLEDINPKTETSAVEDSNTGNGLDQTLDKMWNAINNKLSRVVNSVNGRTGVVVLRPDDVGLSNVDNVSFSDIKQWVINKLTEEFGYKRLELFDSLEQVQALVDQNDTVYRDKAFYASRISATDLRSCIGYIYFDEGRQKLNFQYKAINTIGYTDNSIVYNEKVNENDKTGGGIGVHIWKYEEALELYNGASKEDSGLRIKKEKLAGDLYFFESVYGNGESSDDTAMLYFTNIPADAPKVQIYIDEKYVGEYSLRMKDSSKKYKLKAGDIIFCFFKDYHDTWNDQAARYDLKPGMDRNLTGNGRSIGKVISGPSDQEPNKTTVIKFYQFDGIDSFSLEEESNDMYSSEDSSSFLGRRHMDIRTAKTPMSMFPNDVPIDISCMDAVADTFTMAKTPMNTYPKNIPANVEQPRVQVNFPYGPEFVSFRGKNSNGGMVLNTDATLCVQPYLYFAEQPWQFGETKTKHAVSNWHSPLNMSQTTNDKGELEWTDTLSIPAISKNSSSWSKCNTQLAAVFAGNSSFVGVNLNKSVTLQDPNKAPSQTNMYRFANLSGLKVVRSHETLSKAHLGFDDSEELLSSGPQVGSKMSGGLAVNVGTGLEIVPGKYPETYSEYYDGGKITVRLGDGMKFDESGRVAVDLESKLGRGLYINQDTGRVDIRLLSSTVSTSSIYPCAGLDLVPIDAEPKKRGALIIKLDTVVRDPYNRNEVWGKPAQKSHGGLDFDKYGRLCVAELINLKFVDKYNTEVGYYPLGELAASATEYSNATDDRPDPPPEKVPTTTIRLGEGLKIEKSETNENEWIIKLDN